MPPPNMSKIPPTNILIRGVTAENGSSQAKIERAALVLFAEKSVDQVTTKEIAAKAGLSEGLLYRYAKSKMALAQSMFATIHTRLGRLIREAGANEGSIDEKIAKIVAAYAHCADDDWDLFSYHLLNTHRFLKEDHSTDNPVDAAEDLVANAIKKKEIPYADKVLIAGMALGVILQPALHKAYGRLEGDLSLHQDAMTKAVLAILYQR